MNLFVLFLFVLLYISGWSLMRVTLLEDGLDLADRDDRNALFWFPLFWPFIGLILLREAIDGKSKP